MVLPCLTRLSAFTRFCVFGKYTLHGHFNRLIKFTGQFPLQQQERSFHRSTDTGYAKLNTDNVFSSDVDPDLQVFNNAYELVRNTLIDTADKTLLDAVNRSVRVIDYNVQGGKKARGLTVLKAYKLFVEKEEVSFEKIQQACILGWCIEMFQGLSLMLDDIIDNSVIRRGKPCWYKMPGVGELIHLDGFILERSIFKILEFYFGKSEAYEFLVHDFSQVFYNVVFGEVQQNLNSPLPRPRFENFNLENYYTIAQHKTAYHTYCLPVHCAMHLVGNFSEKDFEETRNIGLKLGTLFQIQDDYLDCFGDHNVMGKIGTDIKNGTCTWLSATFFEQAPEHMKKIMIENYGVHNEDSVSTVMKLYQELKLKEKYYDCVESLQREITLMIKDLPRHSLQKLFFHLLKNLHQRKK